MERKQELLNSTAISSSIDLSHLGMPSEELAVSNEVLSNDAFSEDKEMLRSMLCKLGVLSKDVEFALKVLRDDLDRPRPPTKRESKIIRWQIRKILKGTSNN